MEEKNSTLDHFLKKNSLHFLGGHENGKTLP